MWIWPGRGPVGQAPANETGLACIDETDAGWPNAVVEWIDSPVSEPGAVLAINTPLVVNNPNGMRLCERETGHGHWRVAANPSNLGRPWQGVAIRKRLRSLRMALHRWSRAPGPCPNRTFFECYPYTTLVGASEFGYDDKRPRYKRMGTVKVPIDARRPARASYGSGLIERMWSQAATPPLNLASHPLTDLLVTDDGRPRPGLQAPRRPHRRVDQRVDGVAVVAVRNLEKPGPQGPRFGVRQRAPTTIIAPARRTASRSELRPGCAAWPLIRG